MTGQRAAVGFPEVLPPPSPETSGLMVLQAQLPRLPHPFGDQSTDLEVAYCPGWQLELDREGAERLTLSGMVVGPQGFSPSGNLSLGC